MEGTCQDADGTALTVDVQSAQEILTSHGVVEVIERCEPLRQGYSSDLKYILWADGQPRFLLRLSTIELLARRESEFNALAVHSGRGILCPRPIAFGHTPDRTHCFTLLEYLPEIELSPRGEYELQDAIQMLIERKGRVRGVFVQRRLTVTGPGDLLDINRLYLLSGGDRPQLAPKTVGSNTRLITPLHIESGVIIGADCTIGPNVYVERDCEIGTGSYIRDAVVLRGVTVPAGSRIVDQVVS